MLSLTKMNKASKDQMYNMQCNLLNCIELYPTIIMQIWHRCESYESSRISEGTMSITNVYC